MILQSSYFCEFYESLVMNSGFNKHLFVACILLPYYLHVVDFFSTPCNHHHFLLKKSPIFLWFISWKAHISSADAPTKFAPLSYLIILTIPLCPMKWLKIKMKKSVLNKWTTSKCIALLERQVYKVPPYFLTSFQPSFTTNAPKILVVLNSGSIHILSFGKSAIFCCWSCPLNCLHLTHSPIIDCTNELQLMIQKPEDLIWLMVYILTSTCDLVMTPPHY